MDTYRLVPLTAEHLSLLHRWYSAEEHMELYTCRPAHKPGPIEEYREKWKKHLSDPSMKHFLLFYGDKPVGKISLFDYNPRNRSAEFGYYMPESNRGAGNGSRMMELFLKAAFSDETLALHKLFATTSSGNAASNRLLQKFGFHLDGRLREHFFVGGEKYDQMIYSLLRTEWETGKHA